MKIINNLLFRVNHPKIILVFGEERKTVNLMLESILKEHPETGKNIFLYPVDPASDNKIDFFIKNSSSQILVATSSRSFINGDSPILGDGIKAKIIIDTAKKLLSGSKIIANFDDASISQLHNEPYARSFTFGLRPEADLSASDIIFSQEVNFKINYKGSSIPVWLSGSSDVNKVYAALATALCGIILGLNLVEISQSLKKVQLSS
jgi:hypothetical protein